MLQLYIRPRSRVPVQAITGASKTQPPYLRPAVRVGDLGQGRSHGLGFDRSLLAQDPHELSHPSRVVGIGTRGNHYTVDDSLRVHELRARSFDIRLLFGVGGNSGPSALPLSPMLSKHDEDGLPAFLL